MVPGINLQNEVLQQSLKTPSHYASSQITDIQNKVQQEYENQQSKENENTEEVNTTKITNFQANSHINGGITSSPTGSSFSGDITNTEQQEANTKQQETVESMGDISERINAAANALASIGQIDTISEEVNKAKTLTTTSVKSIKENLDGKVKDSNILSTTEQKKKTKARLIVGTSDTNYSRDKGGNYRMVLMYDSGNNITFSKDDNPVIIIKNDNVKNEGDYWRFVAKIRECCEQKKGYYFEDYLKDHGFMKKEEERIAAIKEAKERIAAYMDSYIKKFGGIQK